jgi:hypothetical protein
MGDWDKAAADALGAALATVARSKAAERVAVTPLRQMGEVLMPQQATLLAGAVRHAMAQDPEVTVRTQREALLQALRRQELGGPAMPHGDAMRADGVGGGRGNGGCLWRVWPLKASEALRTLGERGWDGAEAQGQTLGLIVRVRVRRVPG